LPQKSGLTVGDGQYPSAVAGWCAALSAATDNLRNELQEHIDWFTERLAELDQQLKKLAGVTKLARHRLDPRIGPAVSYTLLAQFAENG
jgi:hypothetical protein